MFLIEFGKGAFVNGEQINWVMVQEDKVRFTLTGENDIYLVAKEYESIFVNNLGALDGNMASVEKAYHASRNQ